MRTIKREIVSAVIISSDNKILFGMKDRTKGPVYPDCWHIPGGGVEEGESFHQALIREVQEETGIDISSYDTSLLDDTDEAKREKTLLTGETVIAHMHFNAYKVFLHDKKSNEISPVAGEFVAFKWVEIPKLGNIKLTPPSVKLFKKLKWTK